MSDSASRIHSTVILGQNVTIGQNVSIGPYSIIYDNVSIGDDTFIDSNVVIGMPIGGRPDQDNAQYLPTHIGPRSVIRSGTVLYTGLQTGENFETGHHVFMLHGCKLGKDVRIHSFCTIKPYCEMGDSVRFQSMISIGEYTRIGNFVWIFPNVVLPNDQCPPGEKVQPVTVEDYAVIAANAIVMPGVTVGKESIVAAMSLVTRDVPAGMLVMGSPAKVVQPAADIRNKFEPEQTPYPWQLRYDKGMPWQGIGYAQWQAQGI